MRTVVFRSLIFKSESYFNPLKQLMLKTKTAKFLAGLSGVAVALSLSVSFALPAGAATIDELQAQINILIAQLNQLKGTTSTSYTFTRDLTIGSTGEDVRMLQVMLNRSADTQVAVSGAGSPGGETTYFGALTRAAVSKFQAKNGITPIAGYFGPKTRAVMNAMAGPIVVVPPGTPIPTTGTGLTVSPATQPTASLAPTSATRVPFTRVTLTAASDGDVTVNGITVERTGLAQDAVFAGVVLLDENGQQIGIQKTLNSNHQVTVGDPFVIKAGQSKTVTIAGNMAASLTSYAGQVASLSVVGVNTTATVSGSLPITGAFHTINATLTLGTAALTESSFDPDTAVTKEIGTTAFKFASVRITAGSAEQIRLWSIRWNQVGSAGSGDLANLMVYVDGTPYPTVVSTDGKYYTATFGSGIVIDKGLAKDIYIQGDIVGSGSAARTVQFDLYRATDIYMTGEVYGYGITGTQSANGTAGAGSQFTSGTPFFDGSAVTISAGTVTSITRALSVPAQNIAVNVPNQVLGGYEVDLKGEPISVQSHVFSIASTTGSGTGLLTNVSLYGPNGNVVAGPVDGVYVSALVQSVTFTDTVTYPIGKGVYTLKGKVASAIGNGGTYIVSTTPSTQWTSVTGQTTGNTISLSTLSSAVTMNTMTVRAAALGVSVATTPVAQTVITGAQGFHFATVRLDASQSGEDVRLSSIPLEITYATMSVSEITTCQLFDGSTALNTGSNVVNPTGSSVASATFTFDQSLTVPKGTVKDLTLKCNVASSVSAGDTVSWGIDGSPSITPTGVTSGNEVTETVTASVGQTMTVAASGSYTVTNDTSLLYKMSQAGTSNVELARLRFTAGASEALNLQQIALQLGNTASNSPADLVGQQVTLWNGATQIGTAQFGVGGAPDNATSTLLNPAPLIAAGESVLITVKGTLTAHNVVDGTPGAFLAITYDGDNVGTNGNYARGVSSQATISSGTTADVTTNGTRIFRAVPTIAITSNGGTLAPGADLYKFTVTNPTSKDLVFQKFTFSIATTGGATTGFTLYGDGVAANASVDNIDGVTGSQVLESIIDATSNAKLVPAISSKTYILKASTVTDTASVAETINIALLADTSFPSCASLMCTVTLVEAGSAATDNVIWSPFSTTTAVATSATEDNLDWVNGYGMPGFPSNADFSIQTWTRPN